MKPKKSEHTSLTGKAFHGTAAEFYLHNNLPFGRWTLADGREVLFNSFEEPLWERRPGAEATAADPHAHVSKVVCAEQFYGDAHRHYGPEGPSARNCTVAYCPQCRGSPSMAKGPRV
jgi:hypothetical protein